MADKSGYSAGLPATVVVVDPGIDPERLLFEGIDTSGEKAPRFSIGETTKVFFARSPQWLRDHENKGNFLVDGVGPVVYRREGKYARYYTLSDIEMIAHALAINGKISGRKLKYILTALKSIGEIWGYL